jgi:hypothetical protein
MRAQALPGGLSNVIRSIELTSAINATVKTESGSLLTTGQTFAPAPGPSVQLIVERSAPGPFMAHFVVLDTCGTAHPWPTFVGGGSQVP